TRATLTSWRARSQTKYIGTIEEVAIGSSRVATILGRVSSKIDLEIVTLVWFDPSRRAVCAASANSSSAKVEPYPTVYVGQERPLRFIRASSSPESRPPLKSKPTGTSLMS